MVGRCWSAKGVSARLVQSLVAFTPGGIIPDQVTVTFWPVVAGTVMVLVGGFEAMLNMPRNAPNEQSVNAARTRGLKIPDLEVEVLCMDSCSGEGGDELRNFLIYSENSRLLDAFTQGRPVRK